MARRKAATSGRGTTRTTRRREGSESASTEDSELHTIRTAQEACGRVVEGWRREMRVEVAIRKAREEDSEEAAKERKRQEGGRN